MGGRAVQVVDGAECMVEVGIGSWLKQEEKGRNTKVFLRADHLEDPIHGSIDTTDIALSTALDAVRASGGRCKYRIVVRRDSSIAADVPWDSVPQKKRYRRIEALEALDGAGQPVGAKVGAANGSAPAPAPAPTPTPAPRAEPAPPAPAVAPAQRTIHPQPQGALVCPLCGLVTAGAGEVRKHAPTGRFAHKACIDGQPAQVETEPAGRTDPPAAAPARGPKLAEARPWEATNSDGSVNLGSYAIQASLSMVELALDLLREHRAATGEPIPPPVDHVKHLAARLLQAADRCQETIRPDGRCDRMDNSHTRSRGAIRSALAVHPVPWDLEPAARQAARDQWVAELAAYAAAMVTAAVELDR